MIECLSDYVIKELFEGLVVFLQKMLCKGYLPHTEVWVCKEYFFYQTL